MSQSTRERLHRWIARSLWTGAGLTIVTLVAGLLWAVLASAGDVAGHAGAKGVFLTTLILWGLNFVTLVVLIALCQLVDDEG